MSGLQSQEGKENNEGVSGAIIAMANIRRSLTSNAEEPVKVTFKLAPSDWHDHATESLWAVPLGGNKYRVQNVPFHAYGVSYDDVVIAKPDQKGRLMVEAVPERGGHSTYRVILNPKTTDEEFEAAWERLGSLGNTYERATDRLIAIDVPPETDIYETYSALESGEQNKLWGFEEAHCGHPLQEE